MSGGQLQEISQQHRFIPVNWKVGALSDIANITMGQSPSGNSYNDEGQGMVFYQGSTDFGQVFPVSRMYTTEPSRTASNNDILLSVRAPVGTMNIAYEDCCIGRGLASISGKNNITAFIRYLLMSNGWFFNNINNSGTTFGSITKDTLFNMPVLIPEMKIINRFQRIAEPVELQIHRNEKQIRELSSLRNWLLPMLMNGQATIED